MHSWCAWLKNHSGGPSPSTPSCRSRTTCMPISKWKAADRWRPSSGCSTACANGALIRSYSAVSSRRADTSDCWRSRGRRTNAPGGRPDDQNQHRVHVGDYDRAAEEARDNDDPFYGIALALAGRASEAIGPLPDLLGRYGSNQVWATYIAIMQAVTRGNTDEIVAAAEACLRLPFADPEGLFHICVVLARVGDSARALMVLRRTVDAGLSCPAALDGEPALRALRGSSEFEKLYAEIERRHRRAVQAFEAAGGHALLT
jgi:hypothetical protein